MSVELLCPSCGKVRTRSHLNASGFRPRNQQGQFLIPCKDCCMKQKREAMEYDKARRIARRNIAEARGLTKEVMDYRLNHMSDKEWKSYKQGSGLE